MYMCFSAACCCGHLVDLMMLEVQFHLRACTSSVMRSTRWWQQQVAALCMMQVEVVVFCFAGGRTLRDSWMASGWRWLVCSERTYATLARRAEEFSARVISTEIVRAADFNFYKASNKTVSQQHFVPEITTP
jgi:hypothetical protein